MRKLKHLLLGAPKNFLTGFSSKAMTLSVLFAWIGLGADGISSSCYGPSEAFMALGATYRPLALWLALATIVTVFIIAFSYNLVIDLFPTGGGGYKVATSLLGPYAGLVAGSALLIDYALTIVISVCSGTEALFSLVSPRLLSFRLPIDAFIILLLTFLNLRGIKESIRLLIPIFVGFVILHLYLIIYGLFLQSPQIPALLGSAIHQTQQLGSENGLFFAIAIFLHAYAKGGGTYTGLEAVSNNINVLTEPRIKTGKRTMLWIAISLSFTAGGIILLYLLWHVQPEVGKTLNASVFHSILAGHSWGPTLLIATLGFEAGLLFVAANTGFLGGPAVLSNMAVDRWVPKIFMSLSSRLVRQNGILLFGASALLLLFVTNAKVDILIILYSSSVFLVFTSALLGLCKYYWLFEKPSVKKWVHFFFLVLGFLICISIFLTVLITSFSEGSWLAILLMGGLIWLCTTIHQQYQISNQLVKVLDQQLCLPLSTDHKNIEPPFDSSQPTAVIFVGGSRGAAVHTLLTIRRLFSSQFQNFIFVNLGIVDSKSMLEQNLIQSIQKEAQDTLNYLVAFCQSHQMPAKSVFEFTVDPAESVVEVAQELMKHYPNCVYFASQLVFPGDSWIQKVIHNKTALTFQRKLYELGLNMMILPVKVRL